MAPIIPRTAGNLGGDLVAQPALAGQAEFFGGLCTKVSSPLNVCDRVVKFIVPKKVYSISVLLIGAGGTAAYVSGTSCGGGGGGGLAYCNNIPVSPGEEIIFVIQGQIPPRAAVSAFNRSSPEQGLSGYGDIGTSMFKKLNGVYKKCFTAQCGATGNSGAGGVGGAAYWGDSSTNSIINTSVTISDANNPLNGRTVVAYRGGSGGFSTTGSSAGGGGSAGYAGPGGTGYGTSTLTGNLPSAGSGAGAGGVYTSGGYNCSAGGGVDGYGLGVTATTAGQGGSGGVSFTGISSTPYHKAIGSGAPGTFSSTGAFPPPEGYKQATGVGYVRIVWGGRTSKSNPAILQRTFPSTNVSSDLNKGDLEVFAEEIWGSQDGQNGLQFYSVFPASRACATQTCYVISSGSPGSVATSATSGSISSGGAGGYVSVFQKTSDNFSMSASLDQATEASFPNISYTPYNKIDYPTHADCYFISKRNTASVVSGGTTASTQSLVYPAVSRGGTVWDIFTRSQEYVGSWLGGGSYPTLPISNATLSAPSGGGILGAEGTPSISGGPSKPAKIPTETYGVLSHNYIGSDSLSSSWEGFGGVNAITLDQINHYGFDNLACTLIDSSSSAFGFVSLLESSGGLDIPASKDTWEFRVILNNLSKTTLPAIRLEIGYATSNPDSITLMVDTSGQEPVAYLEGISSLYVSHWVNRWKFSGVTFAGPTVGDFGGRPTWVEVCIRMRNNGMRNKARCLIYPSRASVASPTVATSSATGSIVVGSARLCKWGVTDNPSDIKYVPYAKNLADTDFNNWNGAGTRFVVSNYSGNAGKMYRIEDTSPSDQTSTSSTALDGRLYQNIPISSSDKKSIYEFSLTLSKALAQPWAHAYIDFKRNPSNGESITIASTNWTFVTGTATGNQTQIKSTLALTLAQLASDLNSSAVADIIKFDYTALTNSLLIVEDPTSTGIRWSSANATSYRLAVSTSSLASFPYPGIPTAVSSNVDPSVGSVIDSAARVGGFRGMGQPRVRVTLSNGGSDTTAQNIDVIFSPYAFNNSSPGFMIFSSSIPTATFQLGKGNQKWTQRMGIEVLGDESPCYVDFLLDPAQDNAGNRAGDSADTTTGRPIRVKLRVRNYFGHSQASIAILPAGSRGEYGTHGNPTSSLLIGPYYSDTIQYINSSASSATANNCFNVVGDSSSRLAKGFTWQKGAVLVAQPCFGKLESLRLFEGLSAIKKIPGPGTDYNFGSTTSFPTQTGIGGWGGYGSQTTSLPTLSSRTARDVSLLGTYVMANSLASNTVSPFAFNAQYIGGGASGQSNLTGTTSIPTTVGGHPCMFYRFS